MPTPNWNLPNTLTLASPNNPPADINALADAVEAALDTEKSQRVAGDTPTTSAVTFIGTWAASAVTATKIGGQVWLNGVIKKSSGDIASGANTAIAVLTDKFKPSAERNLPAVGYIKSHSTEYQANCVIKIGISGNIAIYAASTITTAPISVSYLL